MARVKGGKTTRKRRVRLFKATKGFRHGRKNVHKQAKQAWLKAGVYAYRHRRTKKREFRGLWINKIGAAARIHGLNYQTFMGALNKSGNQINRKSLAALAEHHPEQFEQIVLKLKKK